MVAVTPFIPGADPELTFAGPSGCENVADAGSDGLRACYAAFGREPAAGR